jgi:hypothetical protein
VGWATRRTLSMGRLRRPVGKAHRGLVVHAFKRGRKVLPPGFQRAGGNTGISTTSLTPASARSRNSSRTGEPPSPATAWR